MNDPDNYPALEQDLATVREVLYPAFGRADEAALRFQGRFRRSEQVLILGAVVAVMLGAIAAAASPPHTGSGANARNIWAVGEFLLTFGLGAFAFVVRKLRWHDRWLRQRTIAETLRGEQFLFLGRVGGYAGGEDLKRSLERLRRRLATAGAARAFRAPSAWQAP